MNAHRSPGTAAATLVTLALTVALMVPVARVLFPRLYIMGEDSSFVVVGLIGLLVYGAPVLALAFVRLSPRAVTGTGICLVATARLGVQLLHPVPEWVAVGATAGALLGTTCVILGLGALRSLRAALPLAVVAGLALDTAMRLPTGSWEPVWQDGAAPGALALVTIGAASVAAALALQGPADSGAGIRGTGLAATGPFLMLQLVFLQNLGGVGAAASVTFPAAIAIVLAGDALALAAAWLAITKLERLGLGAGAGLTAVAAIAAYALASATDGEAIGALLVLQVVASACLAIASGRPGAATAGRTVAAMTVAALGFLLLALLWQLHIDQPLPFPRPVVPALAGLWLGLAALASARRPARGTVEQPTLAASSALLAVAVVVGMLAMLTWPTDREPAPGGDEVTIVSFNVRGALGENAMIDPDAVVESIVASDPDVVLLQEVARGWPVFGQYDLLARLAQRLRMPYRYEPAADQQFGNAILSRLPMTVIEAGPLPAVEGSQGRSFISVRVDTSAGPLLVADAHLESNSAEQIDALLAAIGDETPAVVGGDFNMDLSDTANVQRFIDAGLVDAAGATGDPCRTTSAAPTSECDRPDWVWVSADLGIADFRIGSPSASDHLPITVTVTPRRTR